MVSALQDLGVTDGQVTQGYGNAPASAGFHRSEGYIDGHRYSSCVDLTWGLASEAMKDHLVAAGFAPFFRQWAGNYHIHCVYVGARDSKGKVAILPGPRTQIIDFTRGLNGLVNHSALVGKFAPTELQRDTIRTAYETWAPHVATKVYSPAGKWIPCYAFLEDSSVRCEVRAFMAALRVPVVWVKDVLYATVQGKNVNLAPARIKVEGDFARGNLRSLAELIGLKATFAASANKDYYTITLS